MANEQSKIKKFNDICTFIANIFKILAFLLAIAFVVWLFPFIKWQSVPKNLIAKHTPLEVQELSPEPSKPNEQYNRNVNPSEIQKTPDQQPPIKTPRNQSLKNHGEKQSTPKELSSTQPEGLSNKPKTEEKQTGSGQKDYLNVYQYGQLIFTTDKPYEITSDTVVFDKLLIKGRPDYNSPFLYAGEEIRITKINEYIGMLVSGGSVEGPLLRGVYCRVIRK